MSDVEEAVWRLTAWIRDYGAQSTKVFVGDLSIVVNYAKEKLREDRSAANPNNVEIDSK